MPGLGRHHFTSGGPHTADCQCEPCRVERGTIALVNFGDLTARAVAAAVALERERCAKVAEQVWDEGEDSEYGGGWSSAAHEIAERIRRGPTP